MNKIRGNPPCFALIRVEGGGFVLHKRATSERCFLGVDEVLEVVGVGMGHGTKVILIDTG